MKRKRTINDNDISVSDFKARALELFARIAKTKLPIRISKRGKPIAIIYPHLEEPNSGHRKLGLLRDTLLAADDIMSPVSSEDWEANK